MYSNRTRICDYAVDTPRPCEGDELVEGASQVAGGHLYLQERSAPQQAILSNLVRDEETATFRVREPVAWVTTSRLEGSQP